MVEERGGLEVVPESLQAILAARLDALAADEKRLVQDAAVMGKVFWLGFVSSADEIGAADVSRLLHGLERKEFVRRERRTSVGGETQYAFHHVLLRDAAYGQIPRAARAETHLRAARWLEALTADRVEDRADLLAHHYLQAVEYSRASHGDVSRFADRAREAFMVAGGRAIWLGAFDAANGFYRAAADLTPPGHRRAPEIQYRLALRELLLEGTGGDRLLAAIEQLRRGDEPQLAATAASESAQGFWYRIDRATAYRLADLAIELTAPLPPSPAKAEALMRRAAFHMLNWEAEPALARGREALAMAESLGLEHVRARALNIIGVTRVGLGDPGGLEDGQAAVAIARETRNLDILMSSLENLRGSQWYLGRMDEAAATVTDMQTAVSGGRGLVVQSPAIMDANLAYIQGDWQRALYSAGIAAGADPADDSTYWMPWVLAVRVAIHLARGELGPAAALAQRAEVSGRAAQDPQVLIPGLWASGATLAASGRLEEARGLAREALDCKANPMIAWDLGLEWAWLCADLGLQHELEQRIADQPDLPWVRVTRAVCTSDYLGVAEMLVDLHHRPGEAQARLRAAEALAAGGRQTEAAAELERALDFYRSVGASAEISRAERLLAA
jgi:tetratricopeptide (TPR) repeat protein